MLRFNTKNLKTLNGKHYGMKWLYYLYGEPNKGDSSAIYFKSITANRYIFKTSEKNKWKSFYGLEKVERLDIFSTQKQKILGLFTPP